MSGAFDLMEPPILDICDVCYKIYNKLILNHISWKVRKGEHWAVLGPNVAGKTTLLKMAFGYKSFSSTHNGTGDIFPKEIDQTFYILFRVVNQDFYRSRTC